MTEEKITEQAAETVQTVAVPSSNGHSVPSAEPLIPEAEREEVMA